VRADEMILGPPPFQVEQSLGRMRQGRPGSADQCRDTLPQRQVDTLHTRGVQPPTQP
jgi:hypothetical protein